MKMKIILFTLITVFVSGCAGSLKAPCNQYATFCGQKTKINQW